MQGSKSDIIIIGAGLTGLTLAYYLRKRNYSIQILEARDRLGGRIETIQVDDWAPMEMGATWLGKKHVALLELLDELGIETFEQILGKRAIYEPISTSPPQWVQLPPNDDPSYRIKNGSMSVIHKLAEMIVDKSAILFNQEVFQITEESDRMLVKTNQQTFESRIVVSTLPPYLLYKTIAISPALPESIHKVLRNTHTWMGDSIKVGLFYESPFWHNDTLSGTIFSNVGPIPEMYDHSNFSGDKYALKGFLNGNYFSVTRDERRELALTQLRKYYGDVADQYVAYAERVWRDEQYTSRPYETHILPHQNNGDLEFAQSFFSGKLYIGGSETAHIFPGYMDGAVRSARWISNSIDL